MAGWLSSWATTPCSRYEEGLIMPRFYNIVKPSTNKAATPGQEKKGKPQEPPAPPKKPDEKGEGGK